MVTKEEVTWCYRLLLEREPESDTVVREKLACASIGVLVKEFMQSIEFQQKHLSGSAFVADRWVMIEHELGFRMWLNLSDIAVSWAIIRNEFEKAEIAFAKKQIRKGDAVIDIGTNLGFFSLLFSKLVGDQGSVIGFEPLPFLFDAVIKSLNENGFEYCSVYNVALAAEKGSAELIYAPESTNWGGAFLAFDGKGLPNHSSVTVPIAPLTDYTRGFDADFIKIDVEGAEYLVLSSCLDYLVECKPVIMSEIHRQQLERVSRVSPIEYVELLGSVGYACYEIDAKGNLGERITGKGKLDLVNVAFIP